MPSGDARAERAGFFQLRAAVYGAAAGEHVAEVLPLKVLEEVVVVAQHVPEVVPGRRHEQRRGAAVAAEQVLAALFQREEAV